jgi:hypothetical protein
MLAKRFPNEPWPEDEGVLAWRARAALRRMPEAENTSLQRMHVLEPARSRKVNKHLNKAVNWHASCYSAGSSVSMCFGV